MGFNSRVCELGEQFKKRQVGSIGPQHFLKFAQSRGQSKRRSTGSRPSVGSTAPSEPPSSTATRGRLSKQLPAETFETGDEHSEVVLADGDVLQLTSPQRLHVLYVSMRVSIYVMSCNCL